MKNKYLDDCIEIFKKAHNNFLSNNLELIKTGVSERTLCGALMIELFNCLNNSFKGKYSDYYVDVEYNRAKNGRVKHCVITGNGLEERKIRINCDLVIHGRGSSKVQKENLIAIEMKKSYRDNQDKLDDRQRLEALTSSTDVYYWNGEVDPSIVCGYVLGIYYEINDKENKVLIEYYKDGTCFKSYSVSL